MMDTWDARDIIAPYIIEAIKNDIGMYKAEKTYITQSYEMHKAMFTDTYIHDNANEMRIQCIGAKKVISTIMEKLGYNNKSIKDVEKMYNDMCSEFYELMK